MAAVTAWRVENPATIAQIVEDEKKKVPQRNRHIAPTALMTKTSPESHIPPPRIGRHRQQLLQYIFWSLNRKGVKES